MGYNINESSKDLPVFVKEIAKSKQKSKANAGFRLLRSSLLNMIMLFFTSVFFILSLLLFPLMFLIIKIRHISLVNLFNFKFK